MKLKEAIRNYVGVNKLPYDQLVKYIKTNCHENYLSFHNNANFIYRGAKYGQDFVLVKPTERERSSVNVPNFYTLFLSNNPTWKEFPLRNRSLICSTSNLTAKQFGTGLFVVLPHDKARFGVCPTRDIWGSFSRLTDKTSLSIYQFNIQLKKAFDAEKIEEPKNYSELIEALKELAPKIKGNGYYQHYFKETFSGNVIKNIEDLLNPHGNEFRKVDFEGLLNFKGDDREVWTDAPCVLIPRLGSNHFYELTDKLNRDIIES